MLTGRTQTVGVLGTWAVGLASDVVTSKASTITGGTSVHVRRTCKPARHTLIDLLTDRLTLPSHTQWAVYASFGASTALDILVSGSMCYYLQQGKSLFKP
jgi:hypothetical protein